MQCQTMDFFSPKFWLFPSNSGTVLPKPFSKVFYQGFLLPPPLLWSASFLFITYFQLFLSLALIEIFWEPFLTTNIKEQLKESLVSHDSPIASASVPAVVHGYVLIRSFNSVHHIAQESPGVVVGELLPLDQHCLGRAFVHRRIQLLHVTCQTNLG